MSKELNAALLSGRLAVGYLSATLREVLNQGDPDGFTTLANELSHISPTLSILMSDHAVVHLILRENGQLVDQFANGKPPFYRFGSTEEAEPYKGAIEKWKPFLTNPYDDHRLRKVWSQDGDAHTIVVETGHLLGIHPELVEAGYSVFDEVSEIKYSDWLDQEAIDIGLFQELHVPIG